MTLQAWVRPTALSGWQTVILKENGASLAYALYSNTPANEPATHIYTNADLGLNGTAALPLNSWTHLAATYDATHLRLYVNGTLVATRTAPPPIQTSNNPLKIGGNAVWGEWFTGLIDEIRIYNAALTATQIQADMTRPVP